MQPPYSIGAGEVQVWHLLVDEIPSAPLLLPLLDDGERARADRFRIPEHHRLFVAAHGLLRTVLAAYTGICPERLRFTSGEHGKPALLQKPSIEFNLSHTAGHVAVALARSRAVGIDIERIRPTSDLLALAERFFAHTELRWILSHDPEQRTEAFFTCWTAKEAYVKATGQGLARALHGFEVLPASGDPTRFELNVYADAAENARWSIRALDLRPELRGTVAAQGSEWHLRLRSTDELPWTCHADCRPA